ncbi:SDR family NAD(P)-dependent oxidoreductase [Aspergillus ibericus CBS 121593]|uniref:NAD(P)-binding protein n=1 Tax=Aspergillus ibericus CBS 121593 TaxID=1448316 RepID=A0A395HBE8_9EURO|nr:NAD(P)-binding protein [Aspergillus ibericus CBS 121593]RAL05172.1 NAD(P)-binding protein [Aspergillus ibericus CBS 121593]
MLRGTAFITGAASGIGKATAYSLARHGVRQLAIGDINFPAAQETADDLQSQFSDVQVLPLNLDVADPTSIQRAIAETVSRFGRIDYAVNSAGIVGSTAYSSEHDIADWQKTLDVNLNGVWMASREEITVMLKQEKMDDSPRSNRGVIVNVASAYGLVGSTSTLPIVAYTASKHAVVGFTKADAITYAPLGIRINAICPGYVETPLLALFTPEGKQKEESRIPLGRMGQADEIGDAIAFMLSPLSSYMYGSAMVVDGGFTAQ